MIEGRLESESMDEPIKHIKNEEHFVCIIVYCIYWYVDELSWVVTEVVQTFAPLSYVCNHLNSLLHSHKRGCVVNILVGEWEQLLHSV